MANRQSTVNTAFLPAREYLTAMRPSTAALKRTPFAYLKIDVIWFHHIYKFLLLTETPDIQETAWTSPAFLYIIRLLQTKMTLNSWITGLHSSPGVQNELSAGSPVDSFFISWLFLHSEDEQHQHRQKKDKPHQVLTQKDMFSNESTKAVISLCLCK